MQSGVCRSGCVSNAGRRRVFYPCTYRKVFRNCILKRKCEVSLEHVGWFEELDQLFKCPEQEAANFELGRY